MLIRFQTTCSIPSDTRGFAIMGTLPGDGLGVICFISFLRPKALAPCKGGRTAAWSGPRSAAQFCWGMLLTASEQDVTEIWQSV